MDFSQTKRIVLLIDLNPLLHIPSSSSVSYLSTILASASILLSFPPLASSLFAFRLFFSSLSPLLSSSKLHPFLGKSAASLSFQRPADTLSSLSSAFKSVSSLSNYPDLKNAPLEEPQAQFVCRSLVQLVHDYGWDALILDHLGSPCNSRFFVRSNLFILFSPFVTPLKFLYEYVNTCPQHSLSTIETDICNKFCEIFGSVRDMLVNRDIHCCWVNVKFDLEDNKEVDTRDKSVSKLNVFENSVERLGWGISSTECIVLGSTLVPFGLIYPKIAALSKFQGRNGCCKLNLEILDANVKPLECKLCELYLVNDSMFPLSGKEDASHIKDLQCSGTDFYGKIKGFWWRQSNGVITIHVKRIIPHARLDKIVEDSLDVIVLHESVKCDKAVASSLPDLFVDRVLQMLSDGMDLSSQKTSGPLLQIFLSYLYREGFSALVSLSDSNQNLCLGILRAFTIQSVFISVLDTKINSYIQDFCSIQCPEMEIETAKCFHRLPFDDITNSNVVDAPGKGHDVRGHGKAKKITKNFFCSITWTSFCKEAFDNTRWNLEEVYFATKVPGSKRLKFLKCWMKQMKKSDRILDPMGVFVSCQNVPEIQETNRNISKELEKPISSTASMADDLPNDESFGEGVANLLPTEASDAFFNSLQERIQQGLDSKTVDLSVLAARLVASSFTTLWKKHEKSLDSDNSTTGSESQNVSDFLVGEVMDLILVDPKDLFAKHKNVNTSEPTAISSSMLSNSEYFLREYELQVLLRMEILASELAFNTGDSIKQKFVKQICLLLEKAMYHMDGGFFGGTSLQDYAEKILRCRYSEKLGDIVRSVYEKMDLVIFEEEEEEAPNPLLHSEDSSQSARANSQTGESEGGADEQAQRLSVAQEKRDRARRLASFTSRGADLRRVWAPKITKPPSEPSRKSKRERRERSSPAYDSVCETPIADPKRSRCPGTRQASQFSSSVSRALFQDDDDDC